MTFARKLATATAAIAALALTACGAGGDPLSTEPEPGASQPGAEIVVGSADFTESKVLAELYAQALVAKGVQASTKLGIGARELYILGLEDGSISLVPEYTGNLLLYFDKNTTASTPEEIEAALPAAAGEDLALLKSSAAADQDVYVTTKAFSDENGVTSLEDLLELAPDLILGGPSELAERSYGPPGLEQLYGVKFKDFKPYPAPAVKVKDLNDGKIQVATFFTTDSAIADNGYVQLGDPQQMILPQNVIPLATAEVAQNETAKTAIDAVQDALTTEELTALNKQVDTDHLNPDQVAGDWLKAKGLA